MYLSLNELIMGELWGVYFVCMNVLEQVLTGFLELHH